MSSKIQYISAYKIFGISLHKAVCGYEGKIRVDLKTPVPGGWIQVESKNASGRVAVPMVNSVIDIPQGKQKVFFTDSFLNPGASRGLYQIAFFAKIFDAKGNMLEETKLMQKLFSEEDVKRDLRDNLIFILVLLTSITSLFMFIFR